MKAKVLALELYGMPPCLLANSPWKYKSHGTNDIQPRSLASCIENKIGCGDPKAALSIGRARRHAGAKALLKTPCVALEGGRSHENCANIVVKIAGVELA